MQSDCLLNIQTGTIRAKLQSKPDKYIKGKETIMKIMDRVCKHPSGYELRQRRDRQIKETDRERERERE